MLTPADQKVIRAAVQAYRPNPDVDVRGAIATMGIGEALISVLEDDGVPSPVERVMVLAPAGQIGPITAEQRPAIIGEMPPASDERAQKNAFVDRMRAERGLLPIMRSGVGWAEGDYQQFLPRVELEP